MFDLYETQGLGQHPYLKSEPNQHPQAIPVHHQPHFLDPQKQPLVTTACKPMDPVFSVCLFVLCTAQVKDFVSLGLRDIVKLYLQEEGSASSLISQRACYLLPLSLVTGLENLKRTSRPLSIPCCVSCDSPNPHGHICLSTNVSKKKKYKCFKVTDILVPPEILVSLLWSC